jgi:hypothetical protein
MISFLRLRLDQFFDTLLGPSTRYRALALVRVYVAFHFIKKLLLGWRYINLLYGPDSFAEWTGKVFGLIPSESLRSLYVVLCSLLLVGCLFMALGIGKRLAVWSCFVLVVLLQRVDGLVLNGGDDLIKFVLFYLGFADSFRYLALRRSVAPAADSRWGWISNLFTNMAWVTTLGHLCLVYAVSGLHKAHAEVWFNGTAVHYTLLLERFKGTSWNELIANNALLVAAMTYCTLFWELAFSLLIWHKLGRYLAIAIGLGMHVGIYVFMMIHDFETLFIALYAFAFTDLEFSAATAWTKSLFAKFKLKFQPLPSLIPTAK